MLRPVFAYVQTLPAMAPRVGFISNESQGVAVSLGTVLLIIVILMFAGVLPVWPHARNWGYMPSGTLGVVLVVLIVLVLLGRI